MLLGTQSQAQNSDSFTRNDVDIYISQELTDSELVRINQEQDKSNYSHLGVRYVPFTAITPEGGTINNETFKNKVTLLFFWYPTCNCFDISRLKTLYDQFHNNPSFDMAVITFEKDALNDYLLQHPLPFKFGLMKKMTEVQYMNYQNAFPSYLIINKEGTVTRFGKSNLKGLDVTSISRNVIEILDIY